MIHNLYGKGFTGQQKILRTSQREGKSLKLYGQDFRYQCH